MKRFNIPFFLLFLAFLFLQCSYNQVLPPRRLKKHEIVHTFSVTEPGFLYIPRINYGQTRGTGRGDWSGFLNGTLGIVGGGVSYRHYLSGERKNLDILASYEHSFFRENFWGQKVSIHYLTFVPGIDFSPTKSQKVFAKGYGILTAALDQNGKGERVWIAGAGALVGSDFLLKNGNSFSLGVNLSLLGTRSGWGILPALSIGYQFRKKRPIQ